jgi:hypothetical protein
MSPVAAARTTVSTLVAGVRSAAGHPSRPQTAADTGLAINTSLATSAGHQPSGGQSLRKQRTVNPLIVPARYNFLYASSRPASAGSPIDGGTGPPDDADMRRMNRRLAALLEAHPGRAAIVAALVAGVLALLIARLLLGEWSWMPFVMATVVAGGALLLRVQDRKRFERRRQRMD